MTIARRQIFQSVFAAVALAPAAASTLKAAPYVPTGDDLAELIQEYRRQSEAFEARSEFEEWEGLTEETYGPSLAKLSDAPPIPTTPEGAASGIEFALSELAVAGDAPASAEAVLRACIAYLRGGASA